MSVREGAQTVLGWIALGLVGGIWLAAQAMQRLQKRRR